MKKEEAVSTRLAEPLLPQWSIRAFLLTLLASAIVMWIVRSAWVFGWLWAKCISVVLVTALGTFLIYILLYVLGSLFADVGNLFISPSNEPSRRRTDDGVAR